MFLQYSNYVLVNPIDTMMRLQDLVGNFVLREESLFQEERGAGWLWMEYLLVVALRCTQRITFDDDDDGEQKAVDGVAPLLLISFFFLTWFLIGEAIFSFAGYRTRKSIKGRMRPRRSCKRTIRQQPR